VHLLELKLLVGGSVQLLVASLLVQQVYVRAPEGELAFLLVHGLACWRGSVTDRFDL
jgi:hypothetical protein